MFSLLLSCTAAGLAPGDANCVGREEPACGGGESEGAESASGGGCGDATFALAFPLLFSPLLLRFGLAPGDSDCAGREESVCGGGESEDGGESAMGGGGDTAFSFALPLLCFFSSPCCPLALIPGDS